MTDFTKYETQREILIDYLHVMIARSDWHGVSDVANDLRELEAEQREKNCLLESPTQGRADRRAPGY